MKPSTSAFVMIVYILFLMLPIYWLINMSFKTNQEILSTFSLWPVDFTVENYKVIFTDPSWYNEYIDFLSGRPARGLCL
jgi:glycerol transport system permease protein